MLAYTVRRLLLTIPTVLGVTFLAFIIIHAVPGNPAQVALGIQAPPDAVREFNHQLGLDRPVLLQFWLFVTRAVRFDFGDSISLNTSVRDGILSHAVVTVVLVAYVLAIALAVAIPVSVYVASRTGGVVDHFARLLGMVTFVMPVFWFGLLLVLTFSLKVPWFPVAGYGQGVLGALHSITLPAITLGVALAPLFVRTLRASLVSTLNASYIEAARSRGFSERRVLYRHALRPSCTSLITLVGLTAGWLISGAVVVERVFGLPGLGSILVNGVGARDFPLVQGMVFVIGATVVLFNLLTDLVYAVMDPRVRLGARQ
jgi:peptide/nickel transport system permease protein